MHKVTLRLKFRITLSYVTLDMAAIVWMAMPFSSAVFHVFFRNTSSITFSHEKKVSRDKSGDLGRQENLDLMVTIRF